MPMMTQPQSYTSPLPLKAAGHIGQLSFRVGQDWTKHKDQEVRIIAGCLESWQPQGLVQYLTKWWLLAKYLLLSVSYHFHKKRTIIFPLL